MKRPLKLALRILAVLVTLVVLGVLILFFFAGPITEAAIEKYDMNYLGRQIEIADVRINLLNGRSEIDGFRIYEKDGQTVFVSAEEIVYDMTVYSLFDNHFHVEEIALRGAGVHIENTLDEFNFDDIIQRFATAQDTTEIEDSTKALQRLLTKWDATLDTIVIDSLFFAYQNRTLGNKIVLDEINFTSPGISTYDPNTGLDLQLIGQYDGNTFLSTRLNYQTLEYDLDLQIDSVHLDFLYPYLADYIDVNSLRGKITVDLQSDGQYNNDSRWIGSVELHDFAILDNQNDSILAWNSMQVVIDSINAYQHRADLNRFVLDGGYFKFEMYPEGDNWTRALKFDSSEVVINEETGELEAIPGQDYFNVFVYVAESTSRLVSSYKESNYRIDSIGFYDNTMYFADYTLREEAQFLFEDLEITGVNFDSKGKEVAFRMSSTVDKTGSFKALWRFDPANVYEMDLEYEVRNFLLTDISPYSFHHTGYPIYHGDLLYEGHIYIHDRQIDSKNHLFVEDINVGKKVFPDPPYKVPVRFGVSLLKNKDGDIDLQIPVSGDLDDPKFNYLAIAWQVVSNLLVKAVTAPFRLLANAFSVDEESLTELQWLYTQRYVLDYQDKTIKDVGKVLKGDPELKLLFVPVNNRTLEKDEMALTYAKAQYYRQDKPDNYKLTREDTSNILGIATLDTNFIEFLKVESNTVGELYSPRERSMMLVGEPFVDSLTTVFARQRIESFRERLMTVHEVDSSRIVEMPYASLPEPLDTFNLPGPTFIFKFDMDADSIPPAATAVPDVGN